MRHRLEQFIEEISALIRARYPLIYLQTFEEGRCLEMLSKLSEERSSTFYMWSRTEGVKSGQQEVSDAKDPMAVLRWYESVKEKSVLILKDFHPYMKDPGVVRKLRDLGQSLKRSQKNLVLISPVLTVPPELSKEMTVIEAPLPEREELGELVKRAAGVLGEEKLPSSEQVEGLVDAATGLTYDEVENVLAKSIVSRGKLDKGMVQSEKRQIVKKSGLLEFLNTDKVVSVGGLKSLRHWLKLRKRGLGKEARDLGLPLPKGIMLVGVPGCGKSLTAMTVGRDWEIPLLRLDMGKIFSGIVGSSEGNVRQAIATCEAVAPCVLWIDEIEKGISGSQSSGSADGGTTSRVFGTLLTWMQEKKSPVFVLATANDISKLPPEFLRKGRFDEIFFVDLPSNVERNEIFDIHMKRFGWEAKGFDAKAAVEKTEGFSGAEIEQVLVAARYEAFGNAQEFTQEHIDRAISETIPLSQTMTDRIEGLRSWAKNRARLASVPNSAEKADRFSMRTRSLEMSVPSKEESVC